MTNETVLLISLIIFAVCCCFWYIACGCITRSYRVFEKARLIPQEVDPIDLESN